MPPSVGRGRGLAGEGSLVVQQHRRSAAAVFAKPATPTDCLCGEGRAGGSASGAARQWRRLVCALLALVFAAVRLGRGAARRASLPGERGGGYTAPTALSLYNAPPSPSPAPLQWPHNAWRPAMLAER